jgi:hypothetical protein
VPRAYAARRRVTPIGIPAQPEPRTEGEASDDPETEEGAEGDRTEAPLIVAANPGTALLS